MLCFESRVCKQCLQRGEYFFAGKDANRGMARLNLAHFSI